MLEEVPPGESVIAKPLLLTSSFAPHIGGVETVVDQFARQLVNRQIDPLVLTNRWPKDLPLRETVGGVEVCREDFVVPGRTLRQLGEWISRAPVVRRRVVSLARASGVEIVNLHCVSSNAEYSVAISSALDIPLVVSLHGELTGDSCGLYERSLYHRREWRRVMERAAFVTAPSKHALNVAEVQYGRSLANRCMVIRNGVDVRLFSGGVASQTSPRCGVLAVGRLVHVKGFDILIEAWATIPKEIRRAHPLTIVGEGPERADLEALVRSHRIEEITFLGALRQEDVASAMRAALVVVVPSRQEALGLVALEAMVSGAIVVAARAGGLPEIVRPGETGLLFDPGRSKELAEVIAETLTDPSGLQPLADAARSQAESHTWEAYTAALTNVFDQVLER